MRGSWKHKPRFSGTKLVFSFGIALAMAILLVPMKYATSSVIKMPQPLPDIVKGYKSVSVQAGHPGMRNSGVEVKQGDYITILAKGKIDFNPHAKSKGPKESLFYQLSEKDSWKRYKGPQLITIRESGSIYLSYGENYRNPNKHQGSFSVDIIFWNTNDANVVAKFFEQSSLTRPKDNDLKEMAQDFQEFKERQKIFLSLQRARKEVEEINQEIATIESKKVEPEPVNTSSGKEQILEVKKPEREKQQEQKVAKKEEDKPAIVQKDKEIEKTEVPTAEKPVPGIVQKSQEEKEAVVPPIEKEIPVIKDNDKEKRVEELTEKLQNSLQAVKQLEEMKKKLTEREEKEAELLARLEKLEEEGSKQPKNLPVIAIVYPKDGISVDTEQVSLSGVAEHEKGISKLEILVNNKPVGLKDQKDLQIMPKDRKRIEFSQAIHLMEGQNTISIAVQGTEGLTNQKTISIHLSKKREQVYAVVIGINKYKNLPSLKYAVDDAREFYRYLVELNQVPKDHVWLILDEEATLDKLRSTLATSLRRSAGKGDTVIIFLAGHGATETDPSSPDGDGLEKYILPYNADPKDLYASAMPMSEIARIFQRISSERLVFIGDTCYSGASGGRTILGGGTRAVVSGAFWERLSQGKGRVILAASDANEVSFEKDELHHGVFSYYLLEGLRGKADLDGDGMITVDEIYRYVSEKVPRATGQEQHPIRKGETTGQIILGVVK